MVITTDHNMERNSRHGCCNHYWSRSCYRLHLQLGTVESSIHATPSDMGNTMFQKSETMNKVKKAWAIRADKPELEDFWVSEKVVTIGWPELSDLSNFHTREQLRLHYKSRIEGPASEASHNVNQLYQFVHEMQEGDLIATIIKDGNEVMIGTVVGKYRHQLDTAFRQHPHMRSMDWSHTKKISEISREFYEYLQTPSSVLQINKYKSEIIGDAVYKEPNASTDKLKKWSLILGLIVALLTIITGFINLPRIFLETRQTISQNLIRPGSHLIIQEASLNNTIPDHWLFENDPSNMQIADLQDHFDYFDACWSPGQWKAKPLKCQQVFYFGGKSSSGSESIRLVVSSNTREPILIKGIETTYTGYAELSEDSTNIFYFPLARGGGGHYNPFELDRLPYSSPMELKETGLKIDYSKISPHLSVGKSILSQYLCHEDDTDTSCFDYLNLKDQSEGLELYLTLLETLPPGIYDFDVQVRYIYKGRDFISTDVYSFSIIKPSQARLWTINPSDPSLVSLPFILNFTEQAYVPQTSNQIPTTNLTDFLLFKVMLGFDETYFMFDLRSGATRTFKDIGTYSDFNFMIPPVLSPNGLKQIAQIHADRLPSDLMLFNLETLEQRKITNSPRIREISPAWSPSGNQVAFLAFAAEDTQDLLKGEGDIYVYDFYHDQLNRATFTPALIETEIVWVSETQVAYFVPPNIDPYAEVGTISNEKTGVGIVDIITGENRFISEDSSATSAYSNLVYLHETQLLILDDSSDYGSYEFYSLTGKLNSIPKLPRFTCRILDTNPIQKLCWNSEEVSIIDPFSGNKQILLEIETGSLLSYMMLTGPLIVNTAPSGFAFLNPENGFVYQFSEDAKLVQTWEVPNLSEVLAWPIRDIEFISTDIP